MKNDYGFVTLFWGEERVTEAVSLLLAIGCEHWKSPEHTREKCQAPLLEC